MHAGQQAVMAHVAPIFQRLREAGVRTYPTKEGERVFDLFQVVQVLDIPPQMASEWFCTTVPIAKMRLVEHEDDPEDGPFETTTDFLVVTEHDVIAHLFGISRLPEAQAYREWFSGEFMPAIQQHGYYDPSTGHHPPAQVQVEAIERKEHFRDLMNDIAPGLGDLMAEPDEGGGA